ncbi:MAG: hypothetical protein QM691_14650 [Opitutaceae bacterium]
MAHSPVLRRLNLFRWFLPCCLLGLLLIGMGGRLWLLFHYGTPIPDAAQWRTGIPALAPEWAAGKLVVGKVNDPAAFPLLGRVVLGSLVQANRQWDDRVTTVLGSLLLTATFALLLAGAARRLDWIATWAVALCGGILIAFPLAWEETLAGSALPDQLAMFLAFPAVWALLDRKLASPLWWIAAAALLLAQTAATWVAIVTLAVAAVAGVRLCTTRVRRERDLAVILLAMLGLGLHRWLYPGSWSALRFPGAADLSSAFALARPSLAFTLLLPLAARLVIGARDGDRKHSLAPFAAVSVAGLAAVAWLVAESPTRLCGSTMAAQEILLLLVALGFGTVTQLWRLNWQTLPIRSVLTLAWITLLVVGLQLRLERIVGHELPEIADRNESDLAGFTRLLRSPAPATEDSPVLAAAAPALQSPRLRAVLPFSLGHPVRIERGPATTDDFVPLRSDQFALATADEPAWAGGPAAVADGGTLFISLPLPSAATGVLRFRVAGDLGTPRFPFALRSLKTGELVPLELETRTGERWRTVNLMRPADPVVIVAGPAALGTWGAFTHPLEMGTWSWYAGKLAKNWAWVLGAGGLLFAAALLLPLAPRTPRRETFALGVDGRIHVARREES